MHKFPSGRGYSEPSINLTATATATAVTDLKHYVRQQYINKLAYTCIQKHQI